MDVASRLHHGWLAHGRALQTLSESRAYVQSADRLVHTQLILHNETNR